MNAIPRLSLCMIVRDSARTLRACLESIRPWVDEIVVVDTGSHDGTPTMARQFGARVFEFPWCDDFSVARNESLKHAQGEWLFWMDSDDTIDESNGRRLRDLAHSQHAAEILGYVMQVHCPGPCAQGEADCTVVDHVKLFRNLPALRFDGRIHEQVLPAIRQLGGDVGWTDIHVVHSGSDQSPAGRQRKQERDLRILLLEISERPEHPFTLFNLGMTYADIGEHQTAIDYLKRSIAVAGEAESHLRKAYALLVNSLAQLRLLDAAAAACEAGRQLFPDDPELLFRHAILAQQQHRLDEAERSYIRLLGLRGDRHFSSMDPGILGFKTRHNLAAVYQEMSRPDLAELQWRRSTDEMPQYRVGWRGLVECLLQMRRCETAGVECERMLKDDSLRSTAIILRAQLDQLQGHIETAKQGILAATRDYPDEVEPREALCRLLFEHGEPAEAQSALRELACRLPQDGAVLHNLGTVNLRLGQFQSAVEAFEKSLLVRPDSEHTFRDLGNARRLLAETMAAEQSPTAGEAQHVECSLAAN
jgi:tetratricopeptide (TPR) repeat protein